MLLYPHWGDIPLVKEEMSENLVAAMLVTGFIQAQEIEKYIKLLEAVAWVKNIQLLVENQRKLFEFVSLMAPKPYERVMSKLDEIMSNTAYIKSDLVGYELQNFFMDPKDQKISSKLF